MIRRYLQFYGFVQGIGSHYRAKYAAESAGVVGWVQNEDDGPVGMEIQGTKEQVNRMILEVEWGQYVKIENMEARTIPLKSGGHGFRIR